MHVSHRSHVHAPCMCVCTCPLCVPCTHACGSCMCRWVHCMCVHLHVPLYASHTRVCPSHGVQLPCVCPAHACTSTPYFRVCFPQARESLHVHPWVGAVHTPPPHLPCLHTSAPLLHACPVPFVCARVCVCEHLSQAPGSPPTAAHILPTGAASGSCTEMVCCTHVVHMGRGCGAFPGVRGQLGEAVAPPAGSPLPLGGLCMEPGRCLRPRVHRVCVQVRRHHRT